MLVGELDGTGSIVDIIRSAFCVVWLEGLMQVFERILVNRLLRFLQVVECRFRELPATSL